MFLDQVTIDVASGEGGNGAIAWRREKFVAYGGPAGGDGGAGGSVYLVADPQMQTLIDFRYQRVYKATDGENGQNKNMHGKAGKDLIIRVPCGTVIKDVDLDQPIADLTEPGTQILVAQGGRGGRGNARFSTSRNKAPYYAEPGEGAVERQLTLELKLIADIGLLGMPNAGKSTLIATISAARPKIADYPFTTLQPNLGVVRRANGDGVVVADIPGLIEGASEGVGLGHDFLRHVERNRLLLHLVDATAADGGTPWQNYELIQAELARYSPLLASKPQIVVLTKSDSLLSEDLAPLTAEFTQKLGYDQVPFVISAVTRDGVDALVQAMLERLERLPRDTTPLVAVIADPKATANDDSAFEVQRLDEGVYRVDGARLRRWLMVTDTSQAASLRHLYDIMKAMGVMDGLKKSGVEAGDTVYLGNQAFEYYPAELSGDRLRNRPRRQDQLPKLGQVTAELENEDSLDSQNRVEDPDGLEPMASVGLEPTD